MREYLVRGRFAVVVTEAGSYSRLIDSCITQLKAQGPSRTCNESKEELKKKPALVPVELGERAREQLPGNTRVLIPSCSSQFLSSLALSDTTIYEP